MHFSPKKESHSLKKHCNYCQKKRLKMFNGGQVAPRTSIHCPIVGSFWDSNKMSLGVVFRMELKHTSIIMSMIQYLSGHFSTNLVCFSLFSLQPVSQSAFPLPTRPGAVGFFASSTWRSSLAWIFFPSKMVVFSGANVQLHGGGTLPETNIAPKKGWLEYYFPIGEAYFQGLC